MNIDDLNPENLRKTAMSKYNTVVLNTVLEAIQKAADGGSCTLEISKPNGDTLCHILREKGFDCSAARFSDGWHIQIKW